MPFAPNYKGIALLVGLIMFVFPDRSIFVIANVRIDQEPQHV